MSTLSATPHEVARLNAALNAGDSWIRDNPVVPEEQSDPGPMSTTEMTKVLNHHRTHNHTNTRTRYIKYWKECIANKIILEELEK